MPPLYANDGKFETAVLSPDTNTTHRFFDTTANALVYGFFPVDNPGGNLFAYARREGMFQLGVEVLDANNPGKHDDAIRQIILKPKQWDVALENAEKLQAIRRYLVQNPDHDIISVSFGGIHNGCGVLRLIKHVIQKDLDTAVVLDVVGQHRRVDRQWFIEKKEAAKRALGMMHGVAESYKAEFGRLRANGQLRVAPPVVQGLNWEEQLYLISTAFSVALAGYDFDIFA